jgi:hypothetical protein
VGSRLAVVFATVTVVLAGLIAGVPGAQARAADPGVVVRSFVISGEITGIAAVSPSNAWAVGTFQVGNSQTYRMLIVHWNGARWTQDKSFEPVGTLSAISMASASDGWAVGTTSTPGASELDVAHWNGRTWRLDTSVPKMGRAIPQAVATVDGDVWVATVVNEGAVVSAAAMLHRTSGHWYVAPVPGSAGEPLVASLAALSRDNVWADGGRMHWNGTVWKTEPLPRSAAAADLTGMTPGPGGSVWVVGDEEGGAGGWNFSMRWNGRKWIVEPAELTGVDFDAVASIPHGTAVALGSYAPGVGPDYSQPLIAHWSGTTWTVFKPRPTELGGSLNAAAATSPNDVWVAGSTCVLTHCVWKTTLFMHWNGKSWS